MPKTAEEANIENLGRMLAFVTSTAARSDELRGVILFWEGSFVQELGDPTRGHTPYLSDILLSDRTPAQGLQIFEGWLDVRGAGGDADVYLCGGWRSLTWWETCKVREGVPPWFETAGVFG